MTVLRVILSDHLSESISSLEGCDKKKDIVLLAEVVEEANYVKHHKKKIAFLFSAMRHFALKLKEKKYNVVYEEYIKKIKTMTEAVAAIIKKKKIDKIVVTYPGEYRIWQYIKKWKNKFKVDVEIRADNRFLCSIQEFEAWAVGRKELRMEYFYREMRKKYSILMNKEKPEGGKWNYDAMNRKFPKTGLNIPKPYHLEPNKVTKKVLSLVGKEFEEHFGDLEPFYFAVTREEALSILKDFIKNRLPFFGEYQDAMIEKEPWMYHSHISFYLNCGLLEPKECIELAENAYRKGKAPLNAVEGFIRQILGWREYIRGIYWLQMPGYDEKNYFNAKKSLPGFYWNAKTDMNCLKQCVLETKENAYAHHIQRLMVLGNFALIAGISPFEVNEWYLIVYADAYEWVELPNVSGMILFADGGYLASKPYAAGGSYINKMSNYCKGCKYEVSEKNGKNACPFNYLYWDFLIRNKKKLSSNPRLGMMYKVIDKMGSEKIKLIKQDSKLFLSELDSDY